jgi:hypothetical protein
MTPTITADDVWQQLLSDRHSGTNEIRREVQLPTSDARIVAVAAVRDREVKLTVYWPGVWERRVTAEVAYLDFEVAFLNDEHADARWYTIARIAETARDVANALATALTAPESRTPLGYTSERCPSCGGSGRQIVTLAIGAMQPEECEHCDGAGELLTRVGAASAA